VEHVGTPALGTIEVIGRGGYNLDPAFTSSAER